MCIIHVRCFLIWLKSETCHLSQTSLQVDSIASMFNLDPGRPLWIVRKSGNIAVWPRGGLFSGPLVVVGGVYDVKGHKLDATQLAAAVESAVASSSPFGQHALATYNKRRTNTIKKWSKTVIIVSVKKRSGKLSKGHGKVEYDIVTQVTVLLDATTSTVRRVTELVGKQVEHDVVLLDSKCYPLLENESTSGEAFWKSTRKVLAANRRLYSRLTGHSRSLGKASIDLTAEDEESDSSSSDLLPAGKRPCKDCTSSVKAKLDDIARGVSSIERLVNFMTNMQQAFQCVVCRGSVTVPVVAECCGRIVGCQPCVESWLEHHARCPHCSSVMARHFVLRGFDDVLKCLRLTMEEQDSRPVPTPPALSSSVPPVHL